MSKKRLEKDYVVPPLEGLWWAEDMDLFSSKRDKNTWDWTMMIMQPDWINQDLIDEAAIDIQKKELRAQSKVRFEVYDEGLSVQIMHVGSYDDEGPVLTKLHQDWIPQNNYIENGKHHEIYLSDPRPVEPVKLRTVLRQPIKKIQ